MSVFAVASVAGTITFSGSSPTILCGSSECSGTPLAASVQFTSSGTRFIATLTNRAPVAATVQTDILTAVFFNLDGNPTLSRVSAVLAPGSVLDPGNSPTDPQPYGIGGEWAYRAGIGSLVPSTWPVLNQGISSTGLGIFGPNDRFPGANLNGPVDPDGLQYGIEPQFGRAGGNQSIKAATILVNDSVVFTFDGLPSGFDVNTDISDVFFLYGTSVGGPLLDPPVGPPAVPEPASLLLLGSGLIGLARLARRHR